MKKIFLSGTFLVLCTISFAQQKVPSKIDSLHKPAMMMEMPDHHPKGNDSHSEMSMDMPSAFSKNLPMTRNGSGTSWLPDASPMEGVMFHSKNWMYMLHGNLFLRYTNQNFNNKEKRGGDKFDAPNWVMFMGQRNVGSRGLFRFSSMLSLDPLTVGGAGYPLLFQTGETWNGKPLIDRQHPHDLFSELSVAYSYELSKKSDVFLYVGYPGEPALGPVAFMHRPSALANPDAPISHHWVDATHITFGVVTLGFRAGNVKLEGSVFTGKEPDENRYDFDKPRFDSYSGRLSWNPSENWAFQISHAYVKNPEALHAGDVKRTTSSLIYSKPLSNHRSIQATALWGRNNPDHEDPTNAFLLEGDFSFRKTSIYGRADIVRKSGEELVLSQNMHGKIFPTNAFTVGFNQQIGAIGKATIAVGGQMGYFYTNKDLEPFYGKNSLGAQVFFRLYPLGEQ